MKKEVIYKYRATDRNGLTFDFEEKPTANDKSKSWKIAEGTKVQYHSNNQPTEKWKETLETI
jgi:hypothetical protein